MMITLKTVQRMVPIFPIQWDKRFLKYFIAVPLLGLSSVLILKSLHIPSPFDARDWFYLIVLAPLLEELLFRQAFYSLLRRLGFRALPLLILTAMAFSLYHFVGMKFLDNEYFNFVMLQVACAFVMGLLLTWMRDISKSLLPSILLHMLFNAFYTIGIAILMRG